MKRRKFLATRGTAVACGVVLVGLSSCDVPHPDAAGEKPHESEKNVEERLAASGIELSMCSGTSPGNGATLERALTHQGSERTYLVHFPSTYDPSVPTPLVLNFHGTSGTAASIESESGTSAVADERNYIVAYPQGLVLGDNTVFDAGARDFSCSPRDDVDFARKIIDDLARVACVNRRRVYVTGSSNGGRMAYRLACEGGSFITAAAPVIGQLTHDPRACEGKRPVPVRHYHGAEDTISYFDNPGANELSPRSIPEMFELWSTIIGCTDPAETSYQDESTLCQTRDSCDEGSEVTLCVYQGIGHCYVGKPGCSALSQLDPARDMFDFFEKFELPLEAYVRDANQPEPALPELASGCPESN